MPCRKSDLALLLLTCSLWAVPSACAEEKPTTAPNRTTASAVLAWQKDIDFANTWPQLKPNISIDLNQDGQPENFLAVMGGACGGEYILFNQDGKPLSDFIPASHLPIEIQPGRKQLWHSFTTYTPLCNGEKILASKYIWKKHRYLEASSKEIEACTVSTLRNSLDLCPKKH